MTEQIIHQLETAIQQGSPAPWCKPWNCNTIPINHISGKQYKRQKALRCIPTAKGFLIWIVCRKPLRITPLPLNPLIQRIKATHAAVIKLLSNCYQIVIKGTFVKPENLENTGFLESDTSFPLYKVYNNTYFFVPCSF